MQTLDEMESSTTLRVSAANFFFFIWKTLFTLLNKNCKKNYIIHIDLYGTILSSY